MYEVYYKVTETDTDSAQCETYARTRSLARAEKHLKAMNLLVASMNLQMVNHRITEVGIYDEKKEETVERKDI